MLNRLSVIKRRTAAIGLRRAGNGQHKQAGLSSPGVVSAAGRRRTDRLRMPSRGKTAGRGRKLLKRLAFGAGRRRPHAKGLRFTGTLRTFRQLPAALPGGAAYARARAAGLRAGTAPSDADTADLKMQVQQSFRNYLSTGADAIPPAMLTHAARAFLEGFSESRGIAVPPYVLLPARGKVAAVVTVMNEEEALPAILQQLERLPLHETVIIVNGSMDHSFAVARGKRDAIVIHYTQPLGHDVGRAIGAKLAASDILLFVDGDFPVPAEQLALFVQAIERGLDVALNDLSPYLGLFQDRDGVSVVKEFLNRALGRPDLRANSLTAVPHALSRKAVQTIGFQSLMVPPKALALAVTRGLKVGAPVSVNVIAGNKLRRSNTGGQNPVAQLILGDHVEALQAVMAESGNRLSFPDNRRKRSVLGGFA